MGPTAHLTPRALTRLVRPLGLRQLTRPRAFGSRPPISYPVLSLTPDPRYLPGPKLLASRPERLPGWCARWVYGSLPGPVLLTPDQLPGSKLNSRSPLLTRP